VQSAAFGHWSVRELGEAWQVEAIIHTIEATDLVDSDSAVKKLSASNMLLEIMIREG
jgi:hypothetical protein